jgi:hypothetical protein
MWKLIWVATSLLASISAQAETCAVPSADSKAPYETLAGASKRELRSLLSEYMFLQRWTRHSEAVAAGFRYGDRVYGEVLRSGEKFGAKKTVAWRRAYEKSERKRFLGELGANLDMATIDRSVVDWVLRACLGSTVWSQVRPVDDCRFVFTAGLAPDDSSRPIIQPVKFEVRGASCGRWPARALSVKGDAVDCVRSGGGAVQLALTTDRAGMTTQTISPVASPALPPEPQEERGYSDPVSEVISLSRSSDYRLQQLGRGCPTCRLYAADLRPSDPGAVIVRAITVSTRGEGWRACPSGLRCGVYEFSPPDNSPPSGCAGASACRVWRLAETDGEGSDVIQLVYRKPETRCIDCPAGLDYPTAHRRWQEIRDRASARCKDVADSPAQSIRVVPKN